MATELKLLIANCPVALLETVHFLPRVDLTHGDFGRAKLRIERLAKAALIIGRGIFLLLLLCHLRLVLLAISRSPSQKLLLLLPHDRRLACCGHRSARAGSDVGIPSWAVLILCVQNLPTVAARGGLCICCQSKEG